MAALLLGQPLRQGLHQLLPAAERLDLLLLLLGQVLFRQLAQPFLRDFGGDRLGAVGDAFQPLEDVGEDLIEPVDVALVLNEAGARQVVEILHAVVGDPLPHRFHQRQILLEGDRHLRLAQLVEEGREHRPRSLPLP